jgi:outer membrane protein TolC
VQQLEALDEPALKDAFVTLNEWQVVRFLLKAELLLRTKAAAEAAELADQRYAAGLVDLLSVLDTQRTLFNLEEQLVTARGELLNAYSNLYRALGGGWNSTAQELVAQGGSNV